MEFMGFEFSYPLYTMALFLIDFYKAGHKYQYPKGTKQVWSNWVPRGSRILRAQYMIFFGLQFYLKKYLMDNWKKTFFDEPWPKIETFYRVFMKATMGADNIDLSHIKALHDLGYLPIDIFALPEGSKVDFRVPCFVITNTVDHAFWLPNYLETSLSMEIWKPCTSATTARMFRENFVKYAKLSGETDLSFVDKQGHDFSMRGMGGLDDAILSGMAHLLSFGGSDTCAAILAAFEYYGASLDCGGSVNATEHAVMCAGGPENEMDTFENLLFVVYPTGIVSVVSDTWDLWRVLTEYLPKLKDRILAREGALVIRPDSGDPVKIMCGDSSSIHGIPTHQGVLRLLARAMGVTTRPNALPTLNKVGAIYGDSITLERQVKILDRCVNEIGLTSYSVVLGIGSYTYVYTTRDVYGQAMKATAVRTANGTIKNIFKKPVTDSGLKNSLKGIPAVYKTEASTDEDPRYFVVEECTEEQLANCAFMHVFHNSQLLVDHKFQDIRKRVRA